MHTLEHRDTGQATPPEDEAKRSEDRQVIKQIRRALTEMARGMRVSAIPDEAPLDEPQSVADDEVLFNGKSINRKRVVLLTPRCTAAACVMCPLPADALDDRREITADQITTQFNKAMDRGRKVESGLVTIYTNGNWFMDTEVPKETREGIYKKIAQSGAEYVLVESLPQYINEERLEEAKKYLRPEQKLVVAVGLQSADDTVRAISVNTTCTRKGFERANKLLQENGYLMQAFLMIKPPFLTEAEAVEDTVKSIRYLSELGIDNPILCATRVAPGTVLHDLHSEGNFRPPWLWSVVEVIKRAAVEAPKSHPRIAIGELKPANNPDSVVPRNCHKCSERVVAAIEGYNKNPDVALLAAEDCDCMHQYLTQKQSEQETAGATPLRNRVRAFLDRHKQSH